MSAYIDQAEQIIAEERCYTCGDSLADGFETRHSPQDRETGYTEARYICARCIEDEKYEGARDDMADMAYDDGLEGD